MQLVRENKGYFEEIPVLHFYMSDHIHAHLGSTNGAHLQQRHEPKPSIPSTHNFHIMKPL